MMFSDSATYVIIGGGIAAVSCAEVLAEEAEPDETILVLSVSNIVKAASNYRRIGKLLEMFDVEEKQAESIFGSYSNVKVESALVKKIDFSQHKIETADGRRIGYKKLCLCAGGKPKVIAPNNPFVVGIRDTETVEEFQRKIRNAARIIVVGNGGIATELVYELHDVDVIWAIKHESISATFVDAGAAEFFLSNLETEKKPNSESVSKRLKYCRNSNFSTVFIKFIR